MPVDHVDPNQPGIEELGEVSIHPDLPNHKVQVGAQLIPNLRHALINFLKQFHDCFAWSYQHDWDQPKGDDPSTLGRPRPTTR